MELSEVQKHRHRLGTFMSKRFTITDETDIDTIAAAALANQLSAAQIGGISAEAKVVTFFALVANNNDLVGEDGWFVDSTRNLLTQLLGVEAGQVKHLIDTLNKSGLFEFNGKRGIVARHRLNLDDQDVSSRLMKIMALQTDLFSPKPKSKRRKAEDAVKATADTNVVAPTHAPVEDAGDRKDVPDTDPGNDFHLVDAAQDAGEERELTLLVTSLSDRRLARDAMPRLRALLENARANQQPLTPDEDTLLEFLAIQLVGQFGGKKHLIHGLATKLFAKANS